MFFPTPPSPPPKQSWKDSVQTSYTKVERATGSVYNSISELPPGVRLGLAVVGSSVLTLGLLSGYKRFFRRINTSEHVSVKDLAKKRWIKGVVTSVRDADNFRLYHTPGIGWRKPIKFRSVPEGTKDLQDQTIHIRMAGVDAPESAHFGRPSQEYSEEALEWLKTKVLGKRVWCQLILRDQYGRIVAVPVMSSIIPFRYHCISLDMLKAGWATVYEQAGAAYGKWGKEHFLAVEAAAKKAKRGMWEHGTSGESPAEFKRRYPTNKS